MSTDMRSDRQRIADALERLVRTNHGDRYLLAADAIIEAIEEEVTAALDAEVMEDELVIVPPGGAGDME